MSYAEQLHAVYQVAAQYWERDLNHVAEPLKAIEVVKRTGGKMVGFLPQFEGFPTVFFKVYSNNAFEYEMRGLHAAQAMPKVPGVRTPTIVRVFPEYKAILSAKRDWDDTTTPIKRFFVGSLGIDWYTVGRWLRAFHDSQVSQTANEKFLYRKFEKIEAHLAALKELFTPEQIDTMQGIIDRTQVNFETVPIEWVISHGDFGLDNIKIADGKLEIIDFEDCQMAPRAFDILNCLVRLEYLSYFPHRPDAYTSVFNKFMNGYGLQLNHLPGIDFLYLMIKLDMLETYHRRSLNHQNCFGKSWIFVCFKIMGKRRLQKWLFSIT